MKTIYLDHSATTPVDSQVLKAMLPFYKTQYGNASSVHIKGRQARQAVDEARQEIGDFLGTEPIDIIFTSGGTESDNFAIKGVCEVLKDKKDHIITSKIEHPAVLNVGEFMARQGFKVTFLNVDKYGLIDPGDVKKAITSKTAIISIMQANNEVGTIQPIAEIGKIAKKAGVYFHTDAVQSFGKIAVDVEDLNVDLLSVSGHKLYGPKGIGALYIRKGVKILPLQHGGHHERRLRAGTENVPGIVGLAKAVELIKKDYKKEAKRLTALRDRLYKGLQKNITDIQLNGHPGQRLPNNLNISFKYIEGESLTLNLDLKHICVATGSACTSGSLEPSHVLSAMGISPELSHGSIRFSLGRQNTVEEVDYVVQQTTAIVEKLRRMSPLA